MKLIADGGFGKKYPDNTWESYFNSLVYEPDGIGIDIALYGKDIFCYHPRVNVKPFGKDVDKIIEEEIETLLYLNNDELSKFKLKDFAAKLLTQTDFLFLDIKQKSTDILPKILASISKLKLAKEQVIVGARDDESLKLLAKNKSHFQIISLSQDPDAYDKSIDLGADIIRLWKSELTKKRINAIHRRQKEVWANPGARKVATKESTSGKTNSVDLQSFNKLGVDGVLVNDIALARGVIKKIRN